MWRWRKKKKNGKLVESDRLGQDLNKTFSPGGVWWWHYQERNQFNSLSWTSSETFDGWKLILWRKGRKKNNWRVSSDWEVRILTYGNQTWMWHTWQWSWKDFWWFWSEFKCAMTEGLKWDLFHKPKIRLFWEVTPPLWKTDSFLYGILLSHLGRFQLLGLTRRSWV